MWEADRRLFYVANLPRRSTASLVRVVGLLCLGNYFIQMTESLDYPGGGSPLVHILRSQDCSKNPPSRDPLQEHPPLKVPHPLRTPLPLEPS